MAIKIGVLAVDQNPQTEPRTFVKRSIAELLVRRLLAEWIGRRRVRMLIVREPRKLGQPRKAYIPERMPPVDLPGVHFVDPRFPFKPIELQPEEMQ